VDWFYQADHMINGGQRISTFFTYLHANCSMGETEFINIKFNLALHSHFCQFLICDETSTYRGIRFRPIPGNSIFWYNINENGFVDNTSFHAGLPPGENGQKIGLNTWTRETVFVSN
jgi:prolyl 4-hydroxylase